MYLLFIYGAGRNDFDAGESISRDIGRGWAPKIKTFLGPEMAMSEACAISQRKDLRVEIFGAHPFQ
jgi:hypothetical protein